MTLLINIAALALIGFIVWWFWLYRSKEVAAVAGEIEVVVADGVYTPDRITIAAGQSLDLSFLRRDPSPCAEKVIFSDLGLSADLVLDEVRTLHLTAPGPGRYEFTCQMGMYRGVLEVR